MSDSKRLYAIAGVTGNTGAATADALLKQGAGVRVIVRDPQKGEKWAARGAEIAVADLGSAHALSDALVGVDGAYLLSPPDYKTDDYLASRRILVDSIADAVDASGIGHVVFLSSIGAQHETGTGVIRTVHYAEKRLGELRAGTSFVRAAYFVENWGAVLSVAANDGVLPTMFRSDMMIPQVASADVGSVAADVLVAGSKGSGHVIELAGPEDASPNQIGALLGELLGREVNVTDVPQEAQMPTMAAFGFSENLSELYYEMNRGIESGAVNWEGGTAVSVRGTTSPRDVLTAMVSTG